MMRLELDYFTQLGNIDEKGRFDDALENLYINLDSVVESMKNSEEYKKYIEDKYTKENSIVTSNIDMDKVIGYFKENPVDLYYKVLYTVKDMFFDDYNKRFKNGVSSNFKYLKFRSRCNYKIERITTDFNRKYKNGYFNLGGI